MVDRVAGVVDAVLQPLPHVALGILERVPGAVQRVVDVAGHVLEPVLDLAVLARRRVAGVVDGATKASREGREVALDGVEHAAGGVGHGLAYVTEEPGQGAVGRDGIVVERLLDLAEHVILCRHGCGERQRGRQGQADREAEGVATKHPMVSYSDKGMWA